MLRDLLTNEGFEFDDEIFERLYGFADLLLEWNGVHNLTGAKNLNEIYANILDSLFPMTFIEKPEKLLDVGTGAGFPGLVLAVAMPDTNVVLAEPLKKRSSFLRYASVDLGLENVTVEARRVEELSCSPFDLISSRAVTNTALLLELTKNLSNENTSYLFYKGERVFEELSDLDGKLSYKIVEKNRRNYLYLVQQ